MKKIILTSVIALLSLFSFSQDIAQPHRAIVKAANERFEIKNYKEAKKNFSQLISYYPSNAEFNYKFGVCNVLLGGDPNVSVIHLLYAQSAGFAQDVDYYLGRAYHRNYDFNKAIKSFQKYKIKASKSDIEEREVDRYIEMCRNGKGLLNSIKDVVVLDKKQGKTDNFFRFYDLEAIGGKILAIPDELKTKQDKKRHFNGVFYFNGNSDIIYYASYGKSGETGKDIYEAHLMPNGKFGRVAKIGGDINTEYDEDYVFLHADGRTMYFSSTGHNSMGGYDVFRSEYNPGTSTFRNVVNMDFAVNTPDDDIFYIADSLNNNAWFSSSRNIGEDEMNIYNVKVKGIPLNLIFIKGNFLADFDAEIKNAKIVMRDELTGKIISQVKTNSATGDYILSLTKPGLYKIEVSADNSPKTHEGYVQIPMFDQAVALGQELRLIDESGNEKLIINNSFNSPLDVDISELSKEFLRRKSGLDITPEEEILAQETPEVHIAKTTKNAVLSAGFSEEVTVAHIIENAQEDIATINQEIDDINTNNKAAFAYAMQKQREADAKLRESQVKSLEAEKLEGNEYRSKAREANRLLIEADDLSTDGKAAYRIAKRSEKIASEKKSEIDELDKRIALIQKANDQDDFASLTSVLREEKNRINAKKGNVMMSPGEIASKEARNLEDVQELLLAEVKETSETKSRIKNRIDIKKAELAKLSKSKEIERLNNDIERLEAQLVVVSENLTQTLTEVKRNGVEEVILKKEAEFFANQYISPEEIYLADVNAISAEEVNNKLAATDLSITESKVSFGNDPKMVEVVSEENPEILSWADAGALANNVSNPTIDKPKKSLVEEENLENYQVMIAIEKEVIKIENEKVAYLEDPNHSINDAQYASLVEKSDNLALQHNDIYAQQINDIKLSDKDVDGVVLSVDPQYNNNVQTKLAKTNEVEGFLEVRNYRQDLKNQLVALAAINKQDILKEENARNLKKLIKKDVEFQAAINKLDNQINDVNLFVIAYDTENKEIIDSNRPSNETLPEQIELTEKYIETLEVVSKSVDDEMNSGLETNRREALREVQYELSDIIIDAKSKLDSYNSDLDLTISTEGQFADSGEVEPVDISHDYVVLPASEQGTINSLRGDYPEVFNNHDLDDLSMNEKIVVAIDKKIAEQKARLNANPSEDDKAIITMDMTSLVDIRAKVEEGEYVFVNYPARKNNQQKVADVGTDDASNADSSLTSAATDVVRETSNAVNSTLAPVDHQTNDEGAATDVVRETTNAVNSTLAPVDHQTNDEGAETDVARETTNAANSTLAPIDHQTNDEGTGNDMAIDAANTVNRAIANVGQETNGVREGVNDEVNEALNNNAELRTAPNTGDKTLKTAEVDSVIDEGAANVTAVNSANEKNESSNNMGETASSNPEKVNSLQDEEVAVALNEQMELMAGDTTIVDANNPNIRAAVNTTESEELAAFNPATATGERNIERESSFGNELDAQVAAAIEAEEKAIKQMEDINFGFTPESVTPPMEAYGGETFDLAQNSFAGTENEFTNLSKIREIQGKIVGLENAVIDGEVKNNERKLNRKFEMLYSDLAYEEIKLANRLEAFSTNQIETQAAEIEHLEVLNKNKISEQTETKATIKKLNSEIETWMKKAEGKRHQITQSNDEMERNFLAREAFSMESDIIRNQQKIIYLYENADKITQLDETTIRKMQDGVYNYIIDSRSKNNDLMSAHVTGDLDKINKGETLDYSDAYVDYVGHLQVLKIKMDQNNEKQLELSSLINLIQTNETELAELENAFNHAANKKERKTLIDRMNEKQTYLVKINNDKTALNEQVIAGSSAIRADEIKAELLYSRALEMEAAGENIAELDGRTDYNGLTHDNTTGVSITDRSADASSNDDRGDDASQNRSSTGGDELAANSENTTATNGGGNRISDATEEVNENLTEDSNEASKVIIDEANDAMDNDVVDVVNALGDSTTENTEQSSLNNGSESQQSPQANESNVVDERTNKGMNDEKNSNDQFANSDDGNQPDGNSWNENTNAAGVNPRSINESEFRILTDSKRQGAIPMNSEIPKGVVYRIQIGAYSKPVDSNNFTEFTPLSGEQVNDGLVKYYVGWFTSYDDAKYVLQGVKDVGYSDAFVVAYVDQEKTSITKALQTSNETVVSKGKTDTIDFDEKGLLEYYYSFPNAVKAELITPWSGLFYTVQIGVYSKPLTALELGEDKELNIDILPSKNIRYSSGRFQDFEIAQKRNEKMHAKGYSDSFVTAYYNGQRIAIAKAKELYGDSTASTDGQMSTSTELSSNNHGNRSVENESSASGNIASDREAPIVVNTVVTQLTEHGEGVRIIEMEYDVLIGSFGDDIPFDLRTAINNLKSTIEVLEMNDGESTVYYTARVKTIQEARNIQKEFKAAGFEGTEVRAFRIE